MDTFLTQLCAVVSAILTFQSIQKNQKSLEEHLLHYFPWKEKIIKKINGEFKVMTIVHEYLWTS
jgi:hypothetical protein